MKYCSWSAAETACSRLAGELKKYLWSTDEWLMIRILANIHRTKIYDIGHSNLIFLSFHMTRVHMCQM